MRNLIYKNYCGSVWTKITFVVIVAVITVWIHRDYDSLILTKSSMVGKPTFALSLRFFELTLTELLRLKVIERKTSDICAYKLDNVLSPSSGFLLANSHNSRIFLIILRPIKTAGDTLRYESSKCDHFPTRFGSENIYWHFILFKRTVEQDIWPRIFFSPFEPSWTPDSCSFFKYGFEFA